MPSPRQVLVAFATVMGGCTLFTDLDGFVGGANDDAGAGDGGEGVDASTPDAPDASDAAADVVRAIVLVGGQTDGGVGASSSAVALVVDTGAGSWREDSHPEIANASERNVVSVGDKVLATAETETAVGTFVAGGAASWSLHAGTGHTGACTVVVEDTLLAIGGRVGGAVSAEAVGSRVVAPFAWQPTTPLPEPRQSHSCVGYGSFVYVLGGHNAAGTRQAGVFVARRTATGSVSAWTETTPLPSTARLPRPVVVGDRLYVVGSEYGSIDDKTVLSTVIGADGSLAPWQTMTPLPAVRYSPAVVASGQRIFYFGGLEGSGREALMADVDPTNGAVGAWTSTTPLLSPRWGAGATVVALP